MPWHALGASSEHDLGTHTTSPRLSRGCPTQNAFLSPGAEVPRPFFGIPFPKPLPSAPASPLPSTPFFLLDAPPHRGLVAVPRPPRSLSGLPSNPHPRNTHCLKFWRDVSTNGEVSPLGHRSALIRFGKASSLPPPARTPAGADCSRVGQKALTPFPPFPLSARVGGRGKEEGSKKLRGPSQPFDPLLSPTGLPNYLVSLEWERGKSFFWNSWNVPPP